MFRELGELFFKKEKFAPGTKIRVKRSSGIIEDNWTVLGPAEEEGKVRVVRNMKGPTEIFGPSRERGGVIVVGAEEEEEGLQKNVSIEDLEEWNKG